MCNTLEAQKAREGRVGSALTMCGRNERHCSHEGEENMTSVASVDSGSTSALPSISSSAAKHAARRASKRSSKSAAIARRADRPCPRSPNLRARNGRARTWFEFWAMAAAVAHSPDKVAKVPPYLAINAGLFDSADHWSYRDLQKLAKRLNLPCTGRREDVVEQLSAWHRQQRVTGQSGQFHAVQVRATPEGKAISPRLLSPLQKHSGRDSARGILSGKKSARRGGEGATPRSPGGPLQQRSGVLFSPYNMVKLIPSKEHSEMYGQYREPSYVADEDDVDY